MHSVFRKTNLERQIRRTIWQVYTLIISLCVAAVLYWQFHLQARDKYASTPDWILGSIIIIAIACVPMGFSLVMYIGLTKSAVDLFKNHRVLVKKLESVESLGSVTFLAVDKTGTLTESRMSVAMLISALNIPLTEPTFDSRTQADPETIAKRSYIIAGLCNAAQLVHENSFAGDLEQGSATATGYVVEGGNAIDRSLLQWASKNMDLRTILDQYDRRVAMNWESLSQMMVVVTTHKVTKEVNSVVKGSMSTILPMCTYYMNILGHKSPMSEEYASQITALAATEAQKGCTVIAFAQSDNIVTVNVAQEHQLLANLCFVSCVVISDPVPPTIADAVHNLRASGVVVTMITGDWTPTAEGVARQTGIITKETLHLSTILDTDVDPSSINVIEYNRSVVVDGGDLHGMTVSRWNYVFKHSEMVFAHVSPLQKLQIVYEAQQRGHLVGVIGDGVNDCSAMKVADLGIAMGRGADLTRAFADIVLLDNNFEIVANAVQLGRQTFNNVQRIMALINNGSFWVPIISALAATFLLIPTPLGPLNSEPTALSPTDRSSTNARRQLILSSVISRSTGLFCLLWLEKSF